MDGAEQRRVLERLVHERGLSLATLSRDLLRRNVAYLQQFIARGSPRILAEADRRLLADYLGVDESALGGPARSPVAIVPLLAIGASAGQGRFADGEARRQGHPLAAEILRDLGVGIDAASMIVVSGDSMEPTLADGDTILVDRGDRTVTPTGRLFVLRIDDALMVKRVALVAGDWHVSSDNPASSDPGRFVPGAIDLIGRVRWLSRLPS